MEEAQGNNLNLQMLRMYIDVLPNFSGTTEHLNNFVNSCDFVFDLYANINDVILQNYLIKAIQNKLTNRAQILIGSRIELNTWPLIKAALRDCFGDKRDLQCL